MTDWVRQTVWLPLSTFKVRNVCFKTASPAAVSLKKKIKLRFEKALATDHHKLLTHHK